MNIIIHFSEERTKMAYKISICIPTYNRCELLARTLSNICELIIKESDSTMIDVIVCSNGSTDGTMQKLAEIKGKTSVNISILSFEKNMGIDCNILKVMDVADGDYIWTFGDDDVLIDGSITRMLREIDTKYDIYLLNRMQYKQNDDRYKKQERYWMRSNISEDKVYNLSDKNELRLYFNECDSLGGLFSFISSNVVSRRFWHSIERNERFIGSCYAHSAALLTGIKEKGCVIKYIREPLVMANMGNQFSGYENYLSRVMLDFDGIILLSSIFDDMNDVKGDVLRIINRERPVFSIFALGKYSRNDVDKFLDRLEELAYGREYIEQLKQVSSWHFSIFFHKAIRKIVSICGKHLY